MNKIREDISKWPLKKRVEKLKEIFKDKMGYDLNLENPRYFSEMMQWIKLFYHDPRMTQCADKVSFKEYIRNKIGGGVRLYRQDLCGVEFPVRSQSVRNPGTLRDKIQLLERWI